MSPKNRRTSVLVGTALIGTTLIAPTLFGAPPSATAATAPTSASADTSASATTNAGPAPTIGTTTTSTTIDSTTTAAGVSVTAQIDSVDAARGSAVLSGTVSGVDGYYLVVFNDYEQNVTRNGNAWSGTVERLLPGENTISIEIYDQSLNELAHAVLRTTIGSGSGFTAEATRAADGTVTAFGSAPVGETIHAHSAIGFQDYGTSEVGTDGRWALRIPASELDVTQSIRIDFGDPERAVRGIPIASITDESGVPVRAVAFTAPSNGDTVGRRPVFTGTGEDRATVVLTDPSGTEIARTTVAGGIWSAPSEIDLPTGSQTITATQTTADGRVTTA